MLSKLIRAGGKQTFRTTRNGMASDDKDIGWQVDLIQAIEDQRCKRELANLLSDW